MTTPPATLTLAFTGTLPLSAADAKVLDGMTAAITGNASVSDAAAAEPSDTSAATSTPVAAAAANLPAAPAVTPAVAAPVAAAPAVDPIAAKYFPDNIGLAAFPSPENSSVLRLGLLITGRPYVRDSAGLVHTLVTPSDAFPNGYTVNGSKTGGGGNEEPFNQLLVREGMVFADRSTGQWQKWNPAMGSMYNSGEPPAAFTTDASGATTSTVVISTAKAPALPERMSPAPGTSGNTVTVGPGKMFQTISDGIKNAHAGDTLAIDAGTYKEAPPVLPFPLLIQGIGGIAVIDATGLTSSLAYGKGAFVPTADMHFKNIRVTGVATDQTDAELTSCIRPDVGCGYLVLDNVELDGSQCGLGTGGNFVIEITVNGGHFHNDGEPAGASGNGYTHNIYTGAGTSLILNNLVSDAPQGGHAVKHRGWNLQVSGGSFQSSDAAVFDIPNGSILATIDGATITKPAGSNNHAIVDYGNDDISNGNSGLLVTNSTVNALCDNPFCLINSGSIVTFDKTCKVTGAITANGGKIVGL